MNRTRRPGGLCVLVLMALVLVALPAVPATADHSPPPSSDVAGTGTLHGTELVEDQVFLGQPCFAVARHVFGLQGEGTYSGRTAEGQQVIYRAQLAEGQPIHEGPLQVQVENTEPYHHGPNGTHGSDSSCSTATAGAPVPAAFKIFAAEGAEDTDGDSDVDILTGAAWVYRLDDTGAKVPCTGQGTYARTASGQNWHADWTLSADCTVVGNTAGTPGQGIAPAYTAHTHLGTHGPCGGGCVDNFKVDYKQYPPVPGLSVGMAGPSYRAIGQPATVTAGVTNDGAPVSNAAVAFTVTGPGPATPAGGPAVTGDDGRASFTFTATVEGDYTVTVSVTQVDQSASATHVVRFAVPAPAMTLSGLTRSQTEDPVLVVATVVDENAPFDYDNDGNPRRAPVPGLTVDFAVSGAGQATPASGSDTTDTMGKASFTFAGDRAGDYTVSASTTYLGQETSATHTVHLDVKTLSREGAIAASDPPSSSERLWSAVIDPAGDFAYFGTTSTQVVKVDLTDFERVGAIELEDVLVSAVIDPAGDFAYFGTSGSPGKVVKVDLTTFTRVGAITLAAGENWLASAVIDPAGKFAYFGTNTYPAGRVVKVDLATFQRVGALTLLPESEARLTSAVIDPAGDYAYFGSSTAVVKVDLSTFKRVGAVTLPEDEGTLRSAVIDPAGNFAYFGTHEGHVVKIDLTTLRHVGAIEMPSNVYNLTSAVIDPAGNFAYFGAIVLDYYAALYGPNGPFSPDSYTRFAYAAPTADGVVKVDLNAFELAHVLALGEGEESLASAVIDPAGTHAYFGTSFAGTSFHPADDVPTKVVKLSLTRPPHPALVAADDGTYATDYSTTLELPAPGVLANDTDTRLGNGDALTAHLQRRPPGGSVALNPDGSFTYTPDEGFSGTDTFTYLASDGYDYSAPATVSIEVAPSPEGVRGSAYGYFSNVSLFGGPYGARGPDPSVSLPEQGSATPVSASAPSGSAVYGPATIFSSGPLTVSTQGTVASGSVTGSTDIDTINTSQSEVFTAAGAASTCEATASAVGGTTTITNGTLRTSEGDPNVEGDEVVVDIPTNPEPNTVYQGQIETVGDHFEYIFNEQVINPDGSITVYAAHQRLLGPTAIGDLYIGKAECGITLGAGGGNTAPTAADDAYTTDADAPLEVPAPGVLANDDDPDGDVLVATSPSDPANGSVALSPDGSFTYTPAPGFAGTDAFTYTADDSNGGTATATVSITVAAAKAKAVADFDGDGDTDIAVFRPSSGAWFVQGRATTYHGRDGDAAVPADYDGDGDSDVAVFRPTTGAWFVQGSPTTYHGRSGDIPVPADYDGDGDDEPAVFRPASGGWYVAGRPAVFFGGDGDIPVPGHYDADPEVDLAVFRPATGAWFVQGQATAYHGRNGDVPVPADHDGDGDTDLAVFRPSSGGWYVAGRPTVFLGRNGDVPVPGHYAGAAGAEIAVFRPTSGGWYRPGQPTVYFGRSGDAPLPLPHAIRQAFF